MTFDDDDIKAAANRLRQNGWTDTTVSDERLATRKRKPIAPPPTRFGGIDASVKFAAQELARDHDGYSWPLISDIAQAFGLSFDDAVRALAEAKRLSGEAA